MTKQAVCIYNLIVKYQWDENKNRANKAKHGLSFEDAERFDWDGAIETQDDSRDYGEERWVAVSFIDARLCILVYTKRGEKVRIISLRKAGKRENRNFEKAP